MTRDQAPRVSGRTRWRRLVLVLLPVLALSGGLFSAAANGLVEASFGVSANSFLVSGRTFQVAADSLSGDGFEQFGVLDRAKDGTVYPEALSAIGSADLDNLCQSVVQDFPVVGAVTLRIDAGSGDTPAHADRLVVDSHDLRGDALFHDINIGQDASTVDEVPGITGSPGAFAQQAATVRIDRLRQLTRSVSAATFRLPGLHLTVRRGDHSCF